MKTELVLNKLKSHLDDVDRLLVKEKLNISLYKKQTELSVEEINRLNELKQQLEHSIKILEYSNL